MTDKTSQLAGQSGTSVPPSICALPMHGEVKMLAEGLRTRDAHVMEWVAQLRPELQIAILSRPEPWPRLTFVRRFRSVTEFPASWDMRSPQPFAAPSPRERRLWWIRSRAYASSAPDGTRGAFVWNPLADVPTVPPDVPVLFDLLDDWTVHRAFSNLRTELEKGYAAWFARADHVTANSEGTAALARRFGRDDVHLILNGCDPERFSAEVEHHNHFTVGYGGKIGHRLDVDIVAACANAFPNVRFVFAGPVLDRETGAALKALPNADLLGDVPYHRYPRIMSDWDVAWAPHALGDREVGGDLIKLYEYRAAGLQVLATRMIGWDRFPHGIQALESQGFVPALRALIAQQPARDRYETPIEHTWRYKTEQMLELLGV